MNTQNKLQVGTVLQRGDLIAEVYETVRHPIDNNYCHTICRVKEAQPRDIANHTIGRVLLPGDLVTHNYYRP